MALSLALGTLYVVRPTDRGPSGLAEVVDGDSLRLAGLSIRLKGVDAPELQQSCERGGRRYPCGEVARTALQERLGGQPVACRLSGRDRYGRSLAYCAVNGDDLGGWLVEEGLAVSYGGEYAREEGRARARRAGLWAGTFDNPGDWRRERRS